MSADFSAEVLQGTLTISCGSVFARFLRSIFDATLAG